MTAPSHQQPLDDVMDVSEPVRPHRREHAKASPRPDEEELDRKLEVEREEALSARPPDGDPHWA
jgi:hypothetical protein